MNARIDRRALLSLLAAGTVGALSGCATGTAATTGISEPRSVPPEPSNPFGPPPPGTVRTPIPAAPITRLPGTGRTLALTVDDGADADVLTPPGR